MNSELPWEKLGTGGGILDGRATDAGATKQGNMSQRSSNTEGRFLLYTCVAEPRLPHHEEVESSIAMSSDSPAVKSETGLLIRGQGHSQPLKDQK